MLDQNGTSLKLKFKVKLFLLLLAVKTRLFIGGNWRMMFQIGFKLFLREFNLELCYRLVIKIAKQKQWRNDDRRSLHRIGNKVENNKSKKKLVLTFVERRRAPNQVKSYLPYIISFIIQVILIRIYIYMYIYKISFFLNLSYIIFKPKLKQGANC